jgi:exopolysaccharide production protein ExoZ
MQGIVSIQILRAVAALAVLIHHVPYETSVRLGWKNALPELTIGAAGVDLFFVISGFVIVYSSERLFSSSQGPRKFILSRMIRVVPLYWAISTALLIHFLYSGGLPEWFITPGGVVASYLFFPYTRPNGEVGPLFALGWTLNYEMLFYVLFTFAVALPRRSAVFATTLLLASMVTIGNVTKLGMPFEFWCNPIVLEFCFGMAVALAYREGVRLSIAWSCALIAAAVAVLTASQIVGHNILGLTNPIWRTFEWGLPSATIVAATALADHARWVDGAPTRIFAVIGDASYSLYLVHPFAFAAVRRAVTSLYDFSSMQWVFAAVLVCAALVAALGCYYAFERPVTRRLKAWLVPATPQRTARPSPSP